MKESLILYHQQYNSIKKLDKCSKGELFEAIFEYSISGKIPDAGNIAVDLLFPFFKEQIDRDNAKYEEKCKRNRDNANKRVYSNKRTDAMANERMRTDANGCDGMRSDAMAADNDNDNDNDILLYENIPPISPKGEKCERTSKKFIIPSIEEIQEYCTERNNGIDPEEFHDFYTSKGWIVGKTKMKDWKAAVRTWEKNKKGESNESKQPEESYLPY